MNKISIFAVSLVTLLFFLISPGSAHAYLDPGTGSMLLSLLLGALASIMVVIKIFWYQILSLFGIQKKIKGVEDEDGGEEKIESDHSHRMISRSCWRSTRVASPPK